MVDGRVPFVPLPLNTPLKGGQILTIKEEKRKRNIVKVIERKRERGKGG